MPMLIIVSFLLDYNILKLMSSPFSGQLSLVAATVMLGVVYVVVE
jgi:hypothetical protein